MNINKILLDISSKPNRFYLNDDSPYSYLKDIRLNPRQTSINLYHLEDSGIHVIVLYKTVSRMRMFIPSLEMEFTVDNNFIYWDYMFMGTNQIFDFRGF